MIFFINKTHLLNTPDLLITNKENNQRLSRACIVHLVIKKPIGPMSCSGSHLGITINIKNTKFVKDLPMIYA
jgi:hypothetical protein